MNKIEHTTQTPPEPLPQKGQFYRHEDGETYLLANVSPDEAYSLICLEDGGRWFSPVTNINDAFDKDRRHEFTLVTNPFTVTPSHE